MFWVCGLTTLLLASSAQEQSLPSGLDLLYETRTSFAENGAPLIPMGIMQGEKRIALETQSETVLDYYEGGVYRSANVPASSTIDISLGRSQPSKLQHFVDIDGPPGAPRAR